MTFTIDTDKIFVGLALILVVMYGANIYTTNRLSAALIEKPVELSFVLLPAPAAECDSCPDPALVVEAIDNTHNIAYETEVIDYSSKIGQKYLSMYDIQRLPALIVSGSITDERMKGAWPVFSGRTVDDVIVIDNLKPFYDLSNKQMRGVVELTLVTDSTCGNCFDANVYTDMIQRLGIVIGNTNVYDKSTSDGAAIISKYGVTKLPTVIVSPEAAVYNGFTDLWRQQVGTVENDGFFVFREVQKISSEYQAI